MEKVNFLTWNYLRFQIELYILFYFLNLSPKDALTDFREGGWEGERNIYVRGKPLPPVHTPTREQICNLDMCLERESNLRTSSAWDHAPGNQATPARAWIACFSSQRIPMDVKGNFLYVYLEMWSRLWKNKFSNY